MAAIVGPADRFVPIQRWFQALVAYISDMDTRPTALERAFALARSGDYESVTAIRQQLKAEGYALSQLEGPSLGRQLRALCSAAKGLDNA